MSTDSGAVDEGRLSGHGGDLAVATLRHFGVEELFALSGGHIWAFLDAARSQGLRLIDVRHEQTAAFAAEGVAKLTRRPGVAALTAGPGVTNSVSAVSTAHFNGSPLVVLGGRAPTFRWGSGSLQELDHVPLLAPITKLAGTLTSPGEIPDRLHEAVRLALTPHRGPVFLDFPIEVLVATAEVPVPRKREPERAEPDSDAVAHVAHLLATSDRPVLVAGSDVYWERAEQALRAFVERWRLPTVSNGLGRGCLPADHELAFGHIRPALRSDADLVIVVGAPLDFRLGFGDFGKAEVIHIVDVPDRHARHVKLAAAPAGDLAEILSALSQWPGDRRAREKWIDQLQTIEQAARADGEPHLASDAEPIKPARVYGELRKVLDPDAIVVCDGGDFVSYGGKWLDSYQPGCWLDPGPFGCLGVGLGYAIAARVIHPARQVVVLFGDGAAGFSLMDVDTLVRHDLPVVIVVGNNGIWGLEKHPMRLLYGTDVGADLQAECRYDEVVRALGGAGEIVSSPDEIRPALKRAFAAGAPYLVNVLTDPDDIYPRTTSPI
ncbi:MAG: acetolactate synthase [Acidimicrobiia bacterium]